MPIDGPRGTSLIDSLEISFTVAPLPWISMAEVRFGVGRSTPSR